MRCLGFDSVSVALTCVEAGDEKTERRKLCLFLLTSLKVHPLGTHLLADGLQPSHVSGPAPSRQGNQKDLEFGRVLGFAWLSLDLAASGQGSSSRPGDRLVLRPSRTDPGSLITLSPPCVLLAVSCGTFCLRNECQAHPRNVLCKDERSQSGIEKQLLPYYTWPCTQRVHHHVVGTLTLRVAQKSCRV